MHSLIGFVSTEMIVDGLLGPTSLTATMVMLYVVSGWRPTSVWVVTAPRVMLPSQALALFPEAAYDTVILSIGSLPSKPNTHEMVIVLLVVSVACRFWTGSGDAVNAGKFRLKLKCFLLYTYVHVYYAPCTIRFTASLVAGDPIPLFP